jgi:hypothetical protein
VGVAFATGYAYGNLNRPINVTWNQAADRAQTIVVYNGTTES